MPEYFKETVKSFGIRQLFCRFMEEYLWLLIKYIPGFEGMFLRYLFLKLMTKKISGFCSISTGVHFSHSNRMEIGLNFTVNKGCYFDGLGGLTIGDNVGIGPGAVIISQDHHILSGSGKEEWIWKTSIKKKIDIGNNVLIGANSYIKGGVKVGNNVVIGACSAVVENVADNNIVTGNPAQSLMDIMRQRRALKKPTLPC